MSWISSPENESIFFVLCVGLYHTILVICFLLLRSCVRSFSRWNNVLVESSGKQIAHLRFSLCLWHLWLYLLLLFFCSIIIFFFFSCSLFFLIKKKTLEVNVQLEVKRMGQQIDFTEIFRLVVNTLCQSTLNAICAGKDSIGEWCRYIEFTFALGFLHLKRS